MRSYMHIKGREMGNNLRYRRPVDDSQYFSLETEYRLIELAFTHYQSTGIPDNQITYSAHEHYTPTQLQHTVAPGVWLWGPLVVPKIVQQKKLAWEMGLCGNPTCAFLGTVTLKGRSLFTKTLACTLRQLLATHGPPYSRWCTHAHMYHSLLKRSSKGRDCIELCTPSVYLRAFQYLNL